MARFLPQRLISSFVSIIGATLGIFLLVQLHNDPRELYVPDSGYGLTEEQWEMLGEKMGFNDPLPVQYWNWISGAFLGDFGVSLAQQVPVRDIIQNRMRATIELAIGGWAFAILLGIPTGVLAAVKRGTFLGLYSKRRSNYWSRSTSICYWTTINCDFCSMASRYTF